MSIYTRFGTKVNLIAASLIPVWIERKRGEVRRHYSPPKRTKHTIEIEEMPIWHVKARVSDDRPGHGGYGSKICDGKWFAADTLRADGGAVEIAIELKRLNPEDEAKWDAWNTPNGPESTKLFEQIDPRMVA